MAKKEKDQVNQKAEKGKKQGKQASAKGGKSKKKGPVAIPIPEGYIPRLRIFYSDTVTQAMQKHFQYKNKMQIPRLDKITVNVGIGEAVQNPKVLDSVAEEVMTVTGQKPVITKAKKSISNFKLRKGMAVGCSVTLRGNQMYEFFDRLLSVAIPRIRDFRGLSDKSFDGRGNYNMGIKEQIVFPEIDYDKVERVHGMNISIATTAKTDEEALELLKSFGMPFRKA